MGMRILALLTVVACGDASTVLDASLTDAFDNIDSSGLVDAGHGLETGVDADADVDADVEDAASADVMDAARDTDAGCEPTLGAGDWSLELTHDGLDRSYLLHVPPGENRARPVVFNYHGFTSNPGRQQEASAMNAKADEEDFIAVHPAGTGFLPSWNAGACCGTAERSDVDDVGFFRRMLEDVARQTCIDPDRVYVTGFSNGGMMAHRLACEASDVIAAIAPVAGTMQVSEEHCEPSHPISVIHLHGTDDPVVPYEPGAGRSTMDWATRHACGVAETTFETANTVCQTYTGCSEGAEVTLCTLEGVRHVWPGAPESRADIRATDILWDFLSRFERG